MLKEYSINFVIHKVKSSFVDVDVETFTKHLFQYLGYEVEKTNPIVDAGIPDFRITKNGVITYLEVKGEQDGLRHSQLEWIKNNPDKKVIVIFIIKTKIKTKISLLEEKKQLAREIEEII